MNKDVDAYFIDGCGRCPLGGTPDCKVHKWTDELKFLRHIIQDCGLTEQAKWGVPCYTFRGKNVLILSAFVNYCSVNFFKGSLLNDPKNILQKPGENSQATRVIRVTNLDEIKALEADIKAFIYQAIELEKAGLKVDYKKNPEPIPEELETKMDNDPIFKNAFGALTRGRQRGYILYFSAPKQSKTRESRIEKCVEKILNGQGLHDR